MSIILLANIVNGVGVSLTLLAHALISYNDSRVRLGMLISGIGATITTVGSALLASWPIVVLDALWACLSFYGALKPEQNRQNISPIRINHPVILALSSLFGAILLLTHHYDAAASVTAFMYLWSYLALTRQSISREQYLLWTVTASIFVFPHLWIHSSFSVLFNEALGLAIGILGYIKIRLEHHPVGDH